MDKNEFIKLLLKFGVLKFGEFKTKSGRISPYFFNTGNLCTGPALEKFIDFYVEIIENYFSTKPDNLFGPSYKGVPLCVSGAIKLSKKLNKNISFTFNRKEQKNHGEKGLFIGDLYNIRKNVLIIEDILTAGTSICESFDLLKDIDINILGIIIGIDRKEKTAQGISAKVFLEEKYNVPIYSVIDIKEIIYNLYNKDVLGKIWIDKKRKKQIDMYLKEYGC